MGDILHQTERLEMDHNWAGAAESYEKALNLLPPNDVSKKGETHERLAYALYRAAFQAESVEDFRNEMRQVVASYERAKEFYTKLGGQREKTRMIRCDAMIAYAGYWLTSDIPEKKRLLEECWSLTKESLEAFREVGNGLEYGITYNQLSNSPVLGFCFQWDFQTREKLIKEAVEHGEQAIVFLSSFEDHLELARAYAKTAFCLGVFDYYFLEISERMKGSQKVQDY